MIYKCIFANQRKENLIYFTPENFEREKESGGFSPSLAFIIGLAIPIVWMYIQKRRRKSKEKRMHHKQHSYSSSSTSKSSKKRLFISRMATLLAIVVMVPAVWTFLNVLKELFLLNKKPPHLF